MQEHLLAQDVECNLEEVLANKEASQAMKMTAGLGGLYEMSEYTATVCLLYFCFSMCTE